VQVADVTEWVLEETKAKPDDSSNRRAVEALTDAMKREEEPLPAEAAAAERQAAARQAAERKGVARQAAERKAEAAREAEAVRKAEAVREAASLDDVNLATAAKAQCLMERGLAVRVVNLLSIEVSNKLAYRDGVTHGQRLCFWDSCAKAWDDLGHHDGRRSGPRRMWTAHSFLDMFVELLDLLPQPDRDSFLATRGPRGEPPLTPDQYRECVLHHNHASDDGYDGGIEEVQRVLQRFFPSMRFHLYLSAGDGVCVQLSERSLGRLEEDVQQRDVSSSLPPPAWVPAGGYTGTISLVLGYHHFGALLPRRRACKSRRAATSTSLPAASSTLDCLLKHSAGDGGAATAPAQLRRMYDGGGDAQPDTSSHTKEYCPQHPDPKFSVLLNELAQRRQLVLCHTTSVSVDEDGFWRHSLQEVTTRLSCSARFADKKGAKHLCAREMYRLLCSGASLPPVSSSFPSASSASVQSSVDGSLVAEPRQLGSEGPPSARCPLARPETYAPPPTLYTQPSPRATVPLPSGATSRGQGPSAPNRTAATVRLLWRATTPTRSRR